MMTRQEIIASPRPDISPAEAAVLLGYKCGYCFNVRAKAGQDIGFRYFWRGCRLRINKADVLAFIEIEKGGKADD